MLSKNIVPWHIEYFKLREFEKAAEAGRSLGPLPLCPFFLTQAIKSSCERCPPYPWRKGASLSLETNGTQKNPNKQALLSHS